MTKRIFYYVQHLLGIGHLTRASHVAQAMVRHGLQVTMVTGGAPVAGFPGPGVTHVALPEIRAGDAAFSGLTDGRGKPIDDAFRAHRRALLLAACHAARPDVVMLEAFPFGRRQVRFELLPLLDAIHGQSMRPKVVSSVRDILQERVKPARDLETLTYARQYFDHILVHGDPTFFRLGDTFPHADEIAAMTLYGGIVAAPLPPSAADRFDIVVSAGGGAVGAAMLKVAVAAIPLLPAHLTWCLIGGVNLPASDFAALQAALPANATLTRFRTDFGGLLRNVTLSISQAGYNTVCDVLQASCRSLLVPFEAGGETEQRMRATRLQALGLAHVLFEADLSPARMAELARAALAAPPPPPNTLDLNGADHAARIIADLA